MLTESFLTDDARAALASWIRCDPHGSYYSVARELARLEQENQRLDYGKQGLEECLKACRYERDTTRDALTAARAEVQRLRSEMEQVLAKP